MLEIWGHGLLGPTGPRLWLSLETSKNSSFHIILPKNFLANSFFSLLRDFLKLQGQPVEIFEAETRNFRAHLKSILTTKLTKNKKIKQMFKRF